MTLTALGMPALRSRTNGIADPRVVPTTGPLVDTFGRVANDLRVSLTDRCNLRCSYCMPERGLRWLPGEQLLRPDELARLIHIAVTRLGVTSVRFTGGEPLLAHHLDEVVAATARLRPRPEISLTTNGVGLARRAGALAEAGLDRVNVSLDSIDRAHFAAITRRDRLAHVLAGLAAAKAAGLTPVKVNAVLDPTTGREDVVDLLRFCLERGYQLRVIEQMPLDAGHSWRRNIALSADDVLTALVPDYTRAPHAHYPVALEEMAAVYTRLLDDGLDPKTTVIAGDSAGGGLTLALAMALRDRGIQAPAALGLICPWADLAVDIEATRPALRDPLILPSMCTEWAPRYVGSSDPRLPGISPVYGDMSGLPPIVMQTAGDDPICVDADKIETACAASKTSIEHRRFAGMWHDFHLQVSLLPEARDAIADLGARLRGHLHQSQGQPRGVVK